MGKGTTVIRVLLADDHDVVRQGIRRLLEHDPSLEVCGEATNGREAVTMAGELRPDVAVLDLAMPELNGLDATRQMQRASPTTEVLIFTMHNTEQLVRDVVAAGARGYVLKSDPAGDLVTAVKTLAQHKPYFTPSPTAALLDIRMRARETSVDGSGVLTSREREILQLISEGKTNKETADALHISIKTVETHRAAIMRKLHVNSVVELVHYAIRNNIVQP